MRIDRTVIDLLEDSLAAVQSSRLDRRSHFTVLDFDGAESFVSLP